MYKLYKKREFAANVTAQEGHRHRSMLTVLLLLFLLVGCGDEPPTPTPPAPTAALAPTSTPIAVTTVTPAPISPLSPLSTPTPLAASVPVYTYRIVNIYPHDADAFTQGLVYEDGIFFEGTGLKGHSSLRRAHVESGQVLQQHDLAPEFFGEGIAVWDDRIYQLTWRENTAFLYDKEDFTEIERFSYPTEGWGLTHDGERLIMSDGSDTLYFRDPQTFEETGRVQVTYLGQPVTQLNELEYINGEIYANIWQTNLIVRMDPNSGQVVGVIDLAGILENAPTTQPVDVLNGIAYDGATDRLFVTGKLWPAVFEIDLARVQ